MIKPAPENGMTLVVRTVCGWIGGFILVYGIYIILYGHLTPGGGFSGGVIAASAFVLIMLANGAHAAEKMFSQSAASAWVCVGGLLFLSVGVLGLLLAGVFLANFLTTDESAHFSLFCSGVIPICEIGIGILVCSALYLIFVVLTATHVYLRNSKKGADS